MFSKAIGVETVPKESSDINSCSEMDIVSNYVIGESPNFLDLGLSPANTADKLKAVFAPAARV